MIYYDKPISILSLPPGVGSPLQGALQEKLAAYCGEASVYAARYWAAVQAGSRVDTLVELPLHRDIEAEMYARLDGHIYRVEQVQKEYDEFGQPVTRLSLSRSEDCYDPAAV